MVYPADEETFDARATPEFIREGHLNSIQAFLKRIQDFIGYGGRLHDEKGLVFPAGGMIEWPAVAAPSGWLLCDGKFYSRTHGDYADLFAVIGTKYGAYSGTTFNVPDRRGLFTRGYSKIPTISFVPADVSIVNDTIIVVDQEFNHTPFPVRFTTDDTLPAPFLINTTYYIIYQGSDVVILATTRANALVNVIINITSVGVGTSYIHPYLEEDKDSRLKLSFGGNDGEDLGSYQEDALQGHFHKEYCQNLARAINNVVVGAGTGNWPSASLANLLLSAGFQHIKGAKTDGTHGTPRESVESRPRNVNVNYIIKR